MTQPALDPLRHTRIQDRAPTGVRTDPGRLDPGWSPPRQLGSLPRWVLVTVPLALLVALVATVIAVGGFDERTDRIVRVPADSAITTGPFRVTFGVGTAVKTKDNDDKVIWKITVVGTIQTTDPTSDRPDILESSDVVANVPTNRALINVSRVTVGNRIGTDYATGQVTPGLAPVPIRWQFEVPESSPPTEVLRLVVWQQEYVDTTITQTGYLSWNRTSDGYELLVPITVVQGDG